MTYLVHDDRGVSWTCDRCGKQRDYLSESWHQIYIPTLDDPEQILHYCLECMSDKQTWKATS